MGGSREISKGKQTQPCLLTLFPPSPLEPEVVARLGSAAPSPETVNYDVRDHRIIE